MRNWKDLTPAQAAKEFPNGMIGSDVTLPVNENGEQCPFPYDPQQLKNAPLGQYHCPYCGAMVVAGMEHIDYKEVNEQ